MLKHAHVTRDIILQVAQENGYEADSLQDQHELNAGLGLSSLDLAQIIARLDLELDLDPFSSLVAITDVRTVGDLVDAYQQAAVLAGAPNSDG